MVSAPPHLPLWCFFGSTLCCVLVVSFNIEERLPVIKVGPEGSLFGVSVAQHLIDENSTAKENAVLLVGAPTDDRAPEHDKDLRKPGGLYRCSVSTDEKCTRVIVTPRAPSTRINSSNQWLGVSVKSQKPGGKIVVCAHRYTIRGGAARQWEAVIGRCFMLEKTVSPVENSLSFDYTPCLGKRDRNGQYSQEYFGYCQAGTAVTFAEVPSDSGTEEYLAFGAPGSFLWAGSVYTTQVNPAFFAIGISAWSQEEPEGADLIENNNLLGSSLTSGRLFNNNMFYVSGAPGVNVTGAVAILKKVQAESEERLKVVEMVYGDRVASRFGHEVALVDVTGDGLLDLIIGAPQYYDRENKLGGAVYIYANKGTGQIGPSATQKLFGFVDSVFGMSITSIGDVNMDGVQDLAIGAPGMDSGLGAIYIYHGDGGENSKGVRSEPSQVIRAAELVSSGYLDKNVTGLGYSISGGLDMDFNGYPDVAVGSLSDLVVMFQSRPVVNIIGRIEVPKKEIELSSDSRSSKKQEFDVVVCLRYTSLTNTFDERVVANLTLKLDAERTNRDLLSRASFLPSDPTDTTRSFDMNLYRQSRKKERCEVLKTFINDEVQDKLSPVKLELTFTTQNQLPKRTRRQVQVAALTPIMNEAIANMTTAEILFSKDCGDDEVCESNLAMTAHYQVYRDGVWENLKISNGVPVLKLGTEKQIGMVIKVTNVLGEDAHQAKIKVRLPNALRLRGSDVLEGSGSELHCNTAGNESSVVCTLGNPFKASSALTFLLKLTEQASIFQESKIQVELQLQTTSRQPGHDQSEFFPLIIRVEAQLTVDGLASEEQLKFSGVVIGESAVGKPSDAGTILSHRYEVTNSGTGPAKNVSLKVFWPQSIENGKWLLYLLEAKVGDGKGRCPLPVNVNPLQLKHTEDRQKRDIEDADNKLQPVPKESAKRPQASYLVLDCDSLPCLEIDCPLGTISTSDKTINVDFIAVLWNSTFLEEYQDYSQIQVRSRAELTIEQDNIKFSDKSRLDARISTDIFSEVPVSPVPGVKWWIIAAASVAGLILLVFLVLLLWKCGFFKRRDFGDYQKARRHKQASQEAEEKDILY